MCGIFCSLSSDDDTQPAHVLKSCLTNLLSRGPDCSSSALFRLESGHVLELFASVLQTQGKDLCPQPYNVDGNILCWNGDVFGGPLEKEIVSQKQSDTAVVAKHLSECVLQGSSPVEVFSTITGPYSFIYYNRHNNTLWFGRDPVGRHSLLISFSANPLHFCVSSVAHSSVPNCIEVPTVGIFEIDLNTFCTPNGLYILLHSWCEMEEEQITDYCKDIPIPVIKKCTADFQYLFKPLTVSHMEPNELVLFPNLDLLQKASLVEKMNYISSLKEYHENTINLMLLIEHAVKVRVLTNVPLCKNCMTEKTLMVNSCSHSKIAVLFSGGLDSAILARLIDKYVPETESIDLLNVAFEKKRGTSNTVGNNKKRNCGKSTLESSELLFDSIYNVPDRQTGLKTLEELQSLCPRRRWNFVEINISQTELQQERSKSIVHLIFPLRTILDDSLGCALWFAARGKGKLYGSNLNYESPARIIISGMGADEQFGGYMRHRTILKNNGWEALHKQLQMEVERIPTRNLGRDDRVISHHGRQPRMPFLDESVISFVKALPPWEKCYPNKNFPCGVGDKLLLRLVAWHVGLKGAAILPKRAMQFGSRIANSKENAADVSDRL
ncbi:Asparagine synthetase domain-containing protein 1 [Frankliniella fusca]|uniref:Asparagine synthetase domain-containing protein 1 n=1 Tax=Frankliniella fusca TaxID=407009 RepID=A0AAE1HCF5_9NEOP|nr:Asparagine synthetase domain-containing protein 1 [Frankliniella fusca]